MDRSLYKNYFTRSKTPDWMCPTCKKGIIRIIDDSFNTVETRDSRQAHDHPNWEACFITSIYSCLFRCNNEQCQEIVASTGNGSADIEDFYNEHGHQDQLYVEHFRPTFFEPPLAIIDIPESCPTEVSEPIQESFRLFFCSPASAGNNIRMAVESLLTQLGEPTHDSKSKRIPLGVRIQHLSNEYHEFSNLFEAIKRFGNDGSHPDSKITINDMLDAYEIMSHVLQVLYRQNAKRAAELAEKMARRFDQS